MKAGDIVEHYKGGKYLILAIGKFQCSSNKELEGQEMVMYFSIEHQSFNFRLLSEFNEKIQYDGQYLKRFKVVDDKVLIACTMPDRRNLLNMIDTFELPTMLSRLWVGLDLSETKDRLFEELVKAKAENNAEKAQELVDKLNNFLEKS